MGTERGLDYTAVAAATLGACAALYGFIIAYYAFARLLQDQESWHLELRTHGQGDIYTNQERNEGTRKIRFRRASLNLLLLAASWISFFSIINLSNFLFFSNLADLGIGVVLFIVLLGLVFFFFLIVGSLNLIETISPQFKKQVPSKNNFKGRSAIPSNWGHIALPTRILCFFGDQTHNDNASKLLMWPRGVDYDRPFRYRSKWIPPRLEKEVLGWGGSEALVCMKETANPGLYVPLRYVKIKQVEFEGEYTFVYFTLEDFVRYEATYQPDHYSPTISGGIPAGEQHFLVTEGELSSPVDKSSVEGEANHWAVLTGLLMTGDSPAFQSLSEFVFMRFLDVTQPDGSSAKRKADGTGFELKVDTDYLLKLLIVVPRASDRGLQMGSFMLGLEGPFSPGTPRTAQVSSVYDRVNFRFKSANERVTSALSILPSAVPASIGNPPKSVSLRIPGGAIPVKVAPSLDQIATRTAAPMILIASGLALEGVVTLLPETWKTITAIAGGILGAAGLYFKK